MPTLVATDISVSTGAAPTNDIISPLTPHTAISGTAGFMDMNFAPSRFIVYTNEEVSSEILSTGSRLTAPVAGETPRLPEASASVALAGAKNMVTAERVFAGLGVEDEV